MSQARIKHEIFVNFWHEPGPNPNRKARPDLQLCCMHIIQVTYVAGFSMYSCGGLFQTCKNKTQAIL